MLLVVDSVIETGRIEVNDIYKITEDSENILHGKYGIWDPSKGMKVFEPSILKRRANFHGHQFK